MKLTELVKNKHLRLLVAPIVIAVVILLLILDGLGYVKLSFDKYGILLSILVILYGGAIVQSKLK